MKPFSEALQQFLDKRDAVLKDYKLCDELLMEDKLREMGFEYVSGKSFEEEGDTYEYSMYQRGEERVVYTEYYIDREGGMYIQNLFTIDGKIPEKQS